LILRSFVIGLQLLGMQQVFWHIPALVIYRPEVCAY